MFRRCRKSQAVKPLYNDPDRLHKMLYHSTADQAKNNTYNRHNKLACYVDIAIKYFIFFLLGALLTYIGKSGQ